MAAGPVRGPLCNHCGLLERDNQAPAASGGRRRWMMPHDAAYKEIFSHLRPVQNVLR